MATSKIIEPTAKSIQKFWSKVDRQSGVESCWFWEGSKNRFNYGLFAYQGVQVFAHRFAWFITNGSIPAKMEICHRCDNPGCVNPNHLFLGTHKENMHDRDRKKRNNCVQGENHGWSKLSNAQVRDIRRIYEAGEADQYELAARYGVTQATISGIVRWKFWKNI